MGHILLAGPDQLDRRAGHLLGDLHGLTHEVRAPATAKAAAQLGLDDVAFGGGKAGSGDHLGESSLGVLGGRPDLTLVLGPERRRVHGLHAGMVLERIGVGRLDLARRARQSGGGVALLVADEGLFSGQAFLEEFGDRGAGDIGVGAKIPFDGQGVAGLLGVPEGVRDHRHTGLADRNHLLDATHALDLGGVEALHLAAIDRAIAHGGDQHARQLGVDAEHVPSGDLVAGIEALGRLARDLPFPGVLEDDLLGRLKLGGGFGDLAEGRLLAGLLVGDDAVGGGHFLDGNLPLVGGGLHEHHARGGAALADIFLRAADGLAARGVHGAPDALARQILAGRGIFSGHLVPVAFELLGDQLGEARPRPLPHVGTHDADDDAVVGLDHDPGVDLGNRVSGHGLGREGVEPEREPATGGGDADQEGATIEFWHIIHDNPSLRP